MLIPWISYGLYLAFLAAICTMSYKVGRRTGRRIGKVEGRNKERDFWIDMVQRMCRDDPDEHWYENVLTKFNGEEE